MEQIGRSAYRIVSGNGVVVRKTQPPAHGYLQRMSRFLFGGSLPFQNEQYINRLLLENSFSFLRYPRMRNTCSNSSIDFDHVEGKDLSALSERETSMALNALLEFNCLSNIHKSSGIKYLALRILESPSFRTARFVLTSNLSARKKLAGILLLLRQHLFANRPCTVLLHNDLMFSNLRIGIDGYIYFVDFEDSIPESLMVLADAVDLLLNRDSNSIDITKLRDYWERLSSGLHADASRLNLRDQLRLCLLRLSILGRSRATSTEKQRANMNTLCEAVLDRNAYKIWYQNQCHCS